MISRNGIPRDTANTDTRCAICPKDALPFLSRCFEHSMPEQIAQALVDCNAAWTLSATANKGLRDDLAELQARLADRQRNGWLYRAWSIVVSAVAVLGALSILGQCLRWQ